MGFKEYQYELVLPETRKQAKDKSKAPALGCLMFTKAFGGVPCGVKGAGNCHSFAAAVRTAPYPDYLQASSSSWSYWIIEATWVFHLSADI